MGNENSTSDDENPNTITKPPPKKSGVRGSGYRDHQPALHTLIHSASLVPTEENPVMNDKRYSPSQVQSKSVSNR
jgi:hypothetical protein